MSNTHPLSKFLSMFSALLLSSMLIAGASVAVAPTASASSSSATTSQYWWPHNGCTSVPDAPAWPVSFTYACNHHDGCYALRWSSNRGTCDAWFYNDMINTCNSYWWLNLSSCYSWASIYYVGVRVLGQKYWDSNGQLLLISTPMSVG